MSDFFVYKVKFCKLLIITAEILLPPVRVILNAVKNLRFLIVDTDEIFRCRRG